MQTDLQKGCGSLQSCRWAWQCPPYPRVIAGQSLRLNSACAGACTVVAEMLQKKSTRDTSVGAQVYLRICCLGARPPRASQAGSRDGKAIIRAPPPGQDFNGARVVQDKRIQDELPFLSQAFSDKLDFCSPSSQSQASLALGASWGEF